MKIDKYLNPNHPFSCTITGPSNVGKSVFLTEINLNIFIEYDEIYIYSPSLHQELYQKLKKSFSNDIPIKITSNILNEKDFDIVIFEIVKIKDFWKSNCEIETYDNAENLKFPQEYEDGGINILDVLNEEGRNGPRVQAMFEQSRHINLSILIISQD